MNYINSLGYFFITTFQNFSLFMDSSQQKTIINAMAVNEDGVMATGGMKFFTYERAIRE